MAEMEIYELEDGGVYKENNDEFTQQLKFTFTPLKGWNIYACLLYTSSAVRIRQRPPKKEIKYCTRKHYRADVYKRQS